MVKEALDGRAGTCSLCKSAGRGVSRDFVAYRTEIKGGGTASWRVETRSVIDRQTLFVCTGCVQARSRDFQSKRERRRESWLGRVRSRPKLLKSLLFASLVLSIALLAWVAHELKASGMDSETLWFWLVLTPSSVAILVLALRPAWADGPEISMRQVALTILLELAGKWRVQLKRAEVTSTEQFMRWAELARLRRKKVRVL